MLRVYNEARFLLIVETLWLTVSCCNFLCVLAETNKTKGATEIKISPRLSTNTVEKSSKRPHVKNIMQFKVFATLSF